MSGLLIRQATPDDAPAVQAIYAHHVLHGTGTFEEVPPDIDEMSQRMAAVATQGLPWLVAALEDRIAGYAYASQFRPRSSYRFTVEDSVYISPDVMGRGIGTALLQSLIATCTQLDKRELLAVIGDSDNQASIRLHTNCGFQNVGTLKNVGLKFGRWLDVVMLQLPLNTSVR